jgi:hypothetical protein
MSEEERKELIENHVLLEIEHDCYDVIGALPTLYVWKNLAIEWIKVSSHDEFFENTPDLDSYRYFFIDGSCGDFIDDCIIGGSCAEFEVEPVAYAKDSYVYFKKKRK